MSHIKFLLKYDRVEKKFVVATFSANKIKMNVMFQEEK